MPKLLILKKSLFTLLAPTMAMHLWSQVWNKGIEKVSKKGDDALRRLLVTI